MAETRKRRRQSPSEAARYARDAARANAKQAEAAAKQKESESRAREAEARARAAQAEAESRARSAEAEANARREAERLKREGEQRERETREREAQAERAAKAKREEAARRDAYTSLGITMGAITAGYALGTKFGGKQAQQNAAAAKLTSDQVDRLGAAADKLNRGNSRIVGTSAGDKARAIVSEAYALGKSNAGNNSPGYAGKAPSKTIFATIGRPAPIQFATPLLAGAQGVSALYLSQQIKDPLQSNLVRAEGILAITAAVAQSKVLLGSGTTTPRPSSTSIASIEALRERIGRETAERAIKDQGKLIKEVGKAEKAVTKARDGLLAASRAELRQMAMDAGIKGAQRASKERLVELIKAATNKALPVLAVGAVALSALSAGVGTAQAGGSATDVVRATANPLFDFGASTAAGLALGGVPGLVASLVTGLGLSGLREISRVAVEREAEAERAFEGMSPEQRERAMSEAAQTLAAAEDGAFGSGVAPTPEPVINAEPPQTRERMIGQIVDALRPNMSGPTFVDAHRRSDGVYVRGHFRHR